MRRVLQKAVAGLMLATLLLVPGGAGATTPAEVPHAKGAGPAPSPEVAVSQEQAVAIARERLPIPADSPEPVAELADWGEGPLWSLHFPEGLNRPNQHVTVDATSGQVRSYGAYSHVRKAAPPALTRSEAMAQAERWLARLVPAVTRQQLTPAPGPVYYGWEGAFAYPFRWERQAQGYPVEGEGAWVQIDAATGELLSFQLHWRESRLFVLPKRVLTRSEAEALYAGQVKLDLAYQPIGRVGSRQPEYRLLYPVEPRWMDQEGRLLDWSGRPFSLAEPLLVPASPEPFQLPAAPLTREQALGVAQQALGRVDAPTSAYLERRGPGSGQAVWSFQWWAEDGASSAAATVDIATGLLRSLNRWQSEWGEPQPARLTPSEGAKLAITFVQEHRPDLAGVLQLDPQPEGAPPEMPDRSYSFTLLHQGVPVAGRSVHVHVNLAVRQVVGFWADEVTLTDLPEPIPTVSRAGAMEHLLTRLGLRAAWVAFWDDQTGQERSPQLVWSVAPALALAGVDARTGLPITWEGRDARWPLQPPADIAGHPHGRMIEILWSAGILPADGGRFEPDRAVTVAEGSAWLARISGSIPRPYPPGLVEAGIYPADQMEPLWFIDPAERAELRPYHQLSRERFALWAVRVMGYGRLAAMELQLAPPFADGAAVGAGYGNAVTLLAGLGGIDHGAAVRLEPGGPITRAEVARILFTVLMEVGQGR